MSLLSISGFMHIVHQNECRSVLYIQVTTKLKYGVSFSGIGESSDSTEATERN